MVQLVLEQTTEDGTTILSKLTNTGDSVTFAAKKTINCFRQAT